MLSVNSCRPLTGNRAGQEDGFRRSEFRLQTHGEQTPMYGTAASRPDGRLISIHAWPENIVISTISTISMQNKNTDPLCSWATVAPACPS